MTATETPEYRKLELDSSNDLIRHDARRGDRKYPEAALHARNAGLARLRMGQMMFDAGDFVRAAEDWLSAAACFYLATDRLRMSDALDRVRNLDQEGKIPPERRDIYGVLKEREEEQKRLSQLCMDFWRAYQHLTDQTTLPPQAALSWLQGHVRSLPGSPFLYAAISSRALETNERSLASRALDWAQQFDPESPHLAVLRASQLFAFGETVQAARIARELLAIHPTMNGVRFLLAQCLAFRAGPHATEWKVADWDAALEVLQPLIESSSPDNLEKLLALALAVTLQRGIGHDANYHHLLRAFDKLAETIRSPLAAELVSRLRKAQPQIFPQPGSNGEGLPIKPDYLAVRGLFEQFSPLAMSPV